MFAVGARIVEIPGAAMKKPAPKRVLAIDYGRKRIGLAISDELALIAQPLTTLVRTNRQNDIRRLRQICRDREIARIVVGSPLHIRGETSPMSEEAARFAARLRKESGIPVDLQDERLTSWEAGQMAAKLKSSSRPNRAPLDHLAAAIILREYLEGKRGKPGHAAKNEKV